MKNKWIPFIILALVVLLTGCASTNHSEREALLSQEMDCTTADEDIAQLESLLPTKRERARSAVQSVTPIGIIGGAASHNYKDRVDVLTGTTTAELQTRIDEIEETCKEYSDEKE